jgi:hypothetical protein
MIGFIDTFLYNHLQQLTIDNCLRLAPFLSWLRMSSLLLWLTWFWFTNRSLLLRMTSHLRINHTSQSQSYVTTDGQSASVSWCQATIWGLRSDFFLSFAGLLMWAALSDERTGLYFTMYNIFTFYMLLHEFIYTLNYVSLYNSGTNRIEITVSNGSSFVLMLIRCCRNALSLI